MALVIGCPPCMNCGVGRASTAGDHSRHPHATATVSSAPQARHMPQRQNPRSGLRMPRPPFYAIQRFESIVLDEPDGGDGLRHSPHGISIHRGPRASLLTLVPLSHQPRRPRRPRRRRDRAIGMFSDSQHRINSRKTMSLIDRHGIPPGSALSPARSGRAKGVPGLEARRRSPPVGSPRLIEPTGFPQYPQ